MFSYLMSTNYELQTYPRGLFGGGRETVTAEFEGIDAPGIAHFC